MFAERILSLAEEAFLGQAGDMVEQQLIETFVDGVNNDQLKFKILKDRPNTLQGVISIATNKQNLRAREAKIFYPRVKSQISLSCVQERVNLTRTIVRQRTLDVILQMTFLRIWRWAMMKCFMWEQRCRKTQYR